MKPRNLFLIITLAISVCTGSLDLFAQNVDVNAAYGAPEVTVPLFTIQDRDFSYPVYLYYNTNGLKPSEPSGMFGATWDWNLNTSVTRIVRGIPDELNNSDYIGWNAMNTNGDLHEDFDDFTADEDYSDYSEEAGTFNILDGLYDESNTLAKDSEPDLFVVSAPGLNVTFLYDENGNIVTTVPFDGVITPTIVSGAITKIEVEINGRMYTFDIPELSGRQAYVPTGQGYNLTSPWRPFYQRFKNYSNDDIAFYNSQWHLSSITTPGGANIEFAYIDELEETTSSGIKFSTYTSDEYSIVGEVYDDSHSWQSQPFYKLVNEVSQKKFLNVIRTSNNGEIRIIKGQDPLNTDSNITVSEDDAKPIDQETSLISAINFYDHKGDFANAILFDIDRYSKIELGITAIRPFLKKIWFDAEQMGNPISFSYYGIQSNPPIYPGGGTLLDAFGFASYDELHEDGMINGNFDPDLLHVGMLQKVNYADEGYSELIYEPNLYYDANVDADLYGGGLRVSKIINKADNENESILTYEYETADEEENSSGVLLHQPKYFIEQDFYFDPVATTGDEIIGLRQSKFQELSANRRKIWFNYDLDGHNATAYSTGYERVKVKTQNKGSVVNTYDFSKTWNTTSVTFLGENWTAPKIRVARASSQSAVFDDVSGTVGYYKYPFTPVHTLPGMNGRITKSQSYDHGGVLKSETDYTYTLNDNFSYVTALKYERLPTKYTLSGDPEFYHDDMFAYCLYKIPINATILLESTETTSYDENNREMVSGQTSTYEYENDGMPVLREVETLNSKGEKQIAKYTYIKDLNYSSVTGGATAMELKELNDNGFGRIPIEVLSLMEKGGVRYVLGGTTSTYQYNATSKWYYRDTTFAVTFSEPIALSSFTQISISGDNIVRYSDYEVQNEIYSVDVPNKLVLSTVAKELVKNTAIYSDDRVVGSISNASSKNFGFASFEEDDPTDFDLEYHFTINTSLWSGSYFGDGRIDKQSLILSASGSQSADRDNITKSCEKYVVSFWAKTSSSGTIRVLSGNVITDISITAGDWKYYEEVIDVSSLGSTFNVVVGPNSSGLVVNIDELMYYPADAYIGYMLQGEGVTLAQMGDKGKGTYYEYDEARRPTIIRDDDGNIISKTTYGTEDLTSIDLSISPRINAGSILLFARPKITSADYYWDVETGVDSDILSPGSHSFTGISSSGTSFSAPAQLSTIFLKVVYNGNSYFKAIVFDPQLSQN